jgi:hypothetical protein
MINKWLQGQSNFSYGSPCRYSSHAYAVIHFRLPVQKEAHVIRLYKKITLF